MEFNTGGNFQGPDSRTELNFAWLIVEAERPLVRDAEALFDYENTG